MRGDKSFADDLIVHRGVVSGRVALLLRSAETNPLMPRFVPFRNLLPLCVQASARAAAVEVELRRAKWPKPSRGQPTLLSRSVKFDSVRSPSNEGPYQDRLLGSEGKHIYSPNKEGRVTRPVGIPTCVSTSEAAPATRRRRRFHRTTYVRPRSVVGSGLKCRVTDPCKDPPTGPSTSAQEATHRLPRQRRG